MENENNESNLGALRSTMKVILDALEELDSESQQRALQAVATLMGMPLGASFPTERVSTPTSYGVAFSENRDISSKEFLMDKAPKTDVERVACLAYYLTHYKDTPHFKTIDISTLNTEAAQPKLSNAAAAVDNAAKSGLLVPATKGNKQMSAAGEVFVQALPDRDAARESIKGFRPKRKSRKAPLKK